MEKFFLWKQIATYFCTAQLLVLLYLVYARCIFCLPNCVYFVESIFMLMVNLGMLGLLRFILCILISHCFPYFLACNVHCSAFIQYGGDSATDLCSVRPRARANWIGPEPDSVLKSVRSLVIPDQRVRTFPLGVGQWSDQEVAYTSSSLHSNTQRTFWTQTLVVFDICTDIHFDSHMSLRVPIVDTFCFGVTSLNPL